MYSWCILCHCLPCKTNLSFVIVFRFKNNNCLGFTCKKIWTHMYIFLSFEFYCYLVLSSSQAGNLYFISYSSWFSLFFFFVYFDYVLVTDRMCAYNTTNKQWMIDSVTHKYASKINKPNRLIRKLVENECNNWHCEL